MPKIISIIYISIISMLLTACIDRYFIEEIENIPAKIVIEGILTDTCEPKEITISTSSTTQWPKFYPYSNCLVQVFDNEHSIFEFKEDESSPGHYFCNIDEQQLTIGKKFKIRVVTPDEQYYESTFEEMLPCPEIDSIYYKAERQATTIEEEFIDGLQFYIDFNASDYFGHYYRWILEETYEYHSYWPIKNYFDENDNYVSSPIDYLKYVCYKTSVLNEILTLSTKSLTQNSYKGAKLIFVNDHTQRLLYNYSLTVKQLSMDERAYNYWGKLERNNKSKAGLFTKQPALLIGNIVNTNDTTEAVLGYFGVSSVTTKQVLIKTVKEFSFKEIPVCTPSFFNN